MIKIQNFNLLQQNVNEREGLDVYCGYKYDLTPTSGKALHCSVDNTIYFYRLFLLLFSYQEKSNLIWPYGGIM